MDLFHFSILVFGDILRRLKCNTEDTSVMSTWAQAHLAWIAAVSGIFIQNLYVFLRGKTYG
jgi:hypothetical protein